MLSHPLKGEKDCIRYQRSSGNLGYLIQSFSSFKKKRQQTKSLVKRICLQVDYLKKKFRVFKNTLLGFNRAVRFTRVRVNVTPQSDTTTVQIPVVLQPHLY
jgi:hypothetical protein